MSQEKIFATDLFKFQVNIFKIQERLEIVAFLECCYFKFETLGSLFWLHCSPSCCLNVPGGHGRACALLNPKGVRFPQLSY